MIERYDEKGNVFIGYNNGSSVYVSKKAEELIKSRVIGLREEIEALNGRLNAGKAFLFSQGNKCETKDALEAFGLKN